jgi:YfiH family protein
LDLDRSAALITPQWPAPGPVRCVSTTRIGGISRGVYASLNLADHVGDDPDAVAGNRRFVQQILRLPSAPVWLSQVHGSRIVDAAAPGRSLEADGSFATRPNTVCAVLSADCLPVLLCDKSGRRVAAVHAGWRGLLAGVVEAAVRALGLAPDDLMAWIGPGIGQHAYTVGPDMRERFLRRRPESITTFSRFDGRWHADLTALARQALARSAIANVHAHGACTFSERARFFSYRRDRRTGRMATLIWLCEE